MHEDTITIKKYETQEECSKLKFRTFPLVMGPYPDAEDGCSGFGTGI